MDFLIEQVPAPHVSALRVKLQLARERTGDLEFFEEYWIAIMADLDRLAVADTGQADHA